MVYKKNESNGYIDMCGKLWSGVPISDSEYNKIREAFAAKPQSTDGFAYRLRADTLEWELVELPATEPDESEVTAEEIAEAIQEAMA